MGRLVAIISAQVDATASLLPLARRVKARLHWRCSDTAARREVAHMLSAGHERRRFPADCLPDVLWVTGRDDCLRELLAEWARVQMAKQDELDVLEPRGMATVRRVPRRERDAG